VRHYEKDLELFSSRMNLFLAIHAILFGAAGGAFGGSPGTDHVAPVLGVSGIFLATIWFLVAVSSYVWIHEWRGRVLELGQALKDATGVRLGTDVFLTSSAAGGLGRLGWRMRPTTISVTLPVFFAGLWIYVGWLA